MDRPIVFSAPMVRALLREAEAPGTGKTQTRRLAWQTPRIAIKVGDGPIEPIMVPSLWQRIQPGDRLWVREILHLWPGLAEYAVDSRPVVPAGTESRLWIESYSRASVPSIHMPRWASRLTLTVTDVRRQRLQDISEEDARAEGVFRFADGGFSVDGNADTAEDVVRDAFRHLWERLHGADAWNANPEVIALTFTVARRNIDAQEAA